jgi:hypothetical protein
LSIDNVCNILDLYKPYSFILDDIVDVDITVNNTVSLFSFVDSEYEKDNINNKISKFIN